MKSISIYALISAVTVQGAVLKTNKASAVRDYVIDQANGKRAVCAGPGGRVAPIPGAVTRVQLEPKGDVKKVKLRYGPYNVPNMMKKSVMGESGSLWNCGDDKIEKPCEECTLVGLEAGLEYPNGTNANIDSGMWMHHMVALNVGPKRWDATCYGVESSLPHLLVGTSSDASERIFASGNERTVLDMSQMTMKGKRVGYPLYKEDQFRFIIDMMNMNMDDRVVYLTMKYSYLDSPLPQDWINIKPVWLDVDQCAMSEVHADEHKKQFSITSKPWTPNLEGNLINTFAHLHDGGVNAEIITNEKTVHCDSVAKYGEKPEFVYKATGSMMGGDAVATNHISSMSACEYNTTSAPKMTKDQTWAIKAYYDYDKYAGNWEIDGSERERQDIMAIGFLFVEAPRDGFPRPS